jgi:hypothetical protein
MHHDRAAGAPIAKFGDRVALEITERAAVESIPLRARTVENALIILEAVTRSARESFCGRPNRCGKARGWLRIESDVPYLQ